MAHGYKLLTPGNSKTRKGEKQGYVTYILHLAPASLSGFNVCPMATQGCIAACLNTAGRGGMIKGMARLTHADVANGTHNTIQAARIRRTKLFFNDRVEFMRQLVVDIERAILKTPSEYIPVFRLNGTSDVCWETVGCWRDGIQYDSMFEAFPIVQFYDYTKIANRKLGDIHNYSLTFSLADNNEQAARNALAKGMNVAVVFRSPVDVAKAEIDGYLNVGVANGDDSDLRFLDPAGGNVIALYAKGNAVKDRSGFVKDMP